VSHQGEPDRPEQETADRAATSRANHHEGGVPGQLEQLLARVPEAEHLVDDQLGRLSRDVRPCGGEHRLGLGLEPCACLPDVHRSGVEVGRSHGADRVHQGEVAVLRDGLLGCPRQGTPRRRRVVDPDDDGS
jgi:hypothetical protein